MMYQKSPIINLIVAFVIVIPLIPFSLNAYDSKFTMDQADRYLQVGMYLEAIGAYRDVADNAVNADMQARAVLRIGDIYSYFLNNYDVALRFYDFVEKNYYSSIHVANAYFNSGMILYEQNRYQEALIQFKEYVKRFPGGDRRMTAHFMIEACMKPPPAKERKRDVVKEIRLDEPIRILIQENLEQIRMGGSSGCEIKDLGERNRIAHVPQGQSVVLTTYHGSITINGNPVRSVGIVFLPKGTGMLTIDNKAYRGKIRVQQSNGKLRVINILNLEQYLYGVVPKEMSPQWHMEALKSQAVAARTYALYQKEKNRNRDYDVYASTASQVYGGYGAEYARATRAVNETRGQILLYRGKLVLAYFHSNSGGVTEDAEQVWTAEVPYLRSVRDDFSAQVSNAEWKQYVDFEGIKRSLSTKGVDVGMIRSIVPADMSPTGRIKKLRIVHSRGETTLTGNHFRIKVDPGVIKSTLFTINNETNGIRLYGRGYGHGVGMSQWGAYQMAKAGYPYTTILQHYYSGVEVR